MGKPVIKYREIFQDGHIPVLPPGAIYLLETLSDDNIGIPELARIIERVPTVAARLIALANSAWSSPVSPITSLENACARLGFSVVKSTSIALAVASPFDANRCPAFDAKIFWSSALLTADATASLTHLATIKSKSSMSISTNRTAGLLHNLGLLLLADRLPDQVHQAIEQTKTESAPSLRMVLRSLIDIDYTDAGAYLGQVWKLPELLSTVMQCHTDPDFNGSHWEVVCLAGSGASMVSAIQRKTPWLLPEAALRRLGIELSATSRVFETLQLQAEKTRRLAEMLFI